MRCRSRSKKRAATMDLKARIWWWRSLLVWDRSSYVTMRLRRVAAWRRVPRGAQQHQHHHQAPLHKHQRPLTLRLSSAALRPRARHQIRPVCWSTRQIRCHRPCYPQVAQHRRQPPHTSRTRRRLLSLLRHQSTRAAARWFSPPRLRRRMEAHRRHRRRAVARRQI